MKKELRLFFTALMFLTRIPVPSFADHAPEYLQKSSRYFPIVGMIVGALCAAVLLIFQRFLSLELSLLFSMIAGLFITGAFHEDGFADVCDGFGGGWTKDRILEIMKDSRLGTYGTAGLVGMMATKFLILRDLLHSFHLSDNTIVFFVLVAAHALSRTMAVLSIQYFPYVRMDDTSKSKPSASAKLSRPALAFAVLTPLAVFLFLPVYFLLSIPVALLVTLLMNRYFKKWIGGHTGDCLGAVQQVTEVCIYLSFLLIWNYT